jgi:hypothetical protein
MSTGGLTAFKFLMILISLKGAAATGRSFYVVACVHVICPEDSGVNCLNTQGLVVFLIQPNTNDWL